MEKERAILLNDFKQRDKNQVLKNIQNNIREAFNNLIENHPISNNVFISADGQHYIIQNIINPLESELIVKFNDLDIRSTESARNVLIKMQLQIVEYEEEMNS
jgi:hypothetical protein